MVYRNFKSKLFYIFALFSTILACNNPVSVSVTPKISPINSNSKQYIILGDISDDPAEVIEGTQPLSDYLAAHLGEFGITDGQVKIAASIDEMAHLMTNGQVDLYFDSVYPATIVSDASGAYPILRRWRFGVEEYHSVIFTSVESGITSIKDLPGHTLALDSPYSTSGFLLPSVFLMEKDINMVGKRSYNDPVGPDEVGFTFSYDDENTIQWVMSGLVAAGATDDYHFDIAYPPSVTEKLVLLARTESIPRQVVVIRSDIDPEIRDAIIKVLLAASENDAGKAALDAFQTSKFDQFPQGIEEARNRMRDMMGIVEDLPLP